MERDGRWRLAPAFDLTHAHGRGFTRQHQMSFAGKRSGFEAADLLAVGARFGLRQKGRLVVQQVADALSTWPQEARDAGVPEPWIDRLGQASRLGCAPHWQQLVAG